MRQMCREVLAVNAELLAERQGLVQLLPPMMSTHLRLGEDFPEKFDVVVSEVMDIWCLGEGVIPTMKHAFNELLADGGTMLPSRLTIIAQPLELQIWRPLEVEHKVALAGALNQQFQSKFSPLRINQFPHRWLSKEPMNVLEINLSGRVPEQPKDGDPNLEGAKLCIRMGGIPALSARVSDAAVDHDGLLCGYGIWWTAELGHQDHMVTNAPDSPQRSWKQLVRWLDEPRRVATGDPVQVLSCYSENQLNLDDILVKQELDEQHQPLEQQARDSSAAAALWEVETSLDSKQRLHQQQLQTAPAGAVPPLKYGRVLPSADASIAIASASKGDCVASSAPSSATALKTPILVTAPQVLVGEEEDEELVEVD